jgi:hypothetical protein
MVSVLVSVADPSSRESLQQTQLDLEARVGIGPLSPRFTVQIYPFSLVNQV